MCLILALALAAIPQSEYAITFLGTKPLRASVEAQLTIPDNRLLMARGGGIDHLPGEWATFVQDLMVTGGDGKRLGAEPRGAEGWILPAGTKGRVRLAYTVDLKYATRPWPPGNEQAGVWADGRLYTVTKPLFITGAGDDRARVTFHLPSGWRAATPWEPGGSALSYVARGRADLTENSIVVGREPAVELTEEDFTLVLAFVGFGGESRELIATTLRQALRHIIGVFDRTPPARFMMTVLQTGREDGESFETSAAIATATVPRVANRQLWGNNLAHELYHIWIGGQLASSDGFFEWFDEGFTDYYADKALVQSALIEPNDFRTKMEKVMGRHGYFVWSSLFEARGLARASENKGRNRFGVYDGGWAAAFCLDVTIQQESNGRYGLDHLMRDLYDRFALDGAPFDLNDLAAASSRLAGTDLAPFFESHVLGNEPLPLEQCLADAGLEGSFQQYAAELWISPDPGATCESAAIYRTILTGRRGLHSRCYQPCASI